MIDITNLVDDLKRNVGIWCPATEDAADLAGVASVAISTGAGMICVPSSVVHVVWPWLEGHDVKIMPRFYVGGGRTITDAEVSDLAVSINAAFKRGANGAMVFVGGALLGNFADMMAPVRDDLFFNKDLIIGLNINEIDSDKWADVFRQVMRIRAHAIAFALTRDTGNRSDFVGRVYGMLNAVPTNFIGDICWMVGASGVRMEQVMRLTAALRPELVTRTRLLMCE